jgi:hypothetical protein
MPGGCRSLHTLIATCEDSGAGWAGTRFADVSCRLQRPLQRFSEPPPGLQLPMSMSMSMFSEPRLRAKERNSVKATAIVLSGQQRRDQPLDQIAGGRLTSSDRRRICPRSVVHWILLGLHRVHSDGWRFHNAFDLLNKLLDSRLQNEGRCFIGKRFVLPFFPSRIHDHR